MDENAKNRRFNNATVLSIIIIAVILIFSFLLEMMVNNEVGFSVSRLIRIMPHQPLYIIFILLSVAIVVTISFLTRRYDGELNKKQEQANKEHERMLQVENFTQHLIHDNLEAELSEAGNNDTLTLSLIELRDALRKNREDNLKIRKEEERRHWLADALAHFSEILRTHIHNIEQLSFNVVKDLAKHVNAVQGGFYMLDDDDPYNKFFKLIAFFAYDRKKFTDQRIKWGDGLIGTCALEQKTIHVKNVPESYITVTSGLGEAKPRNILIVPMMYEGQIYGVLEFTTLGQFEPDHITLIEKTAESIGATLSAGKISMNTAKLLEESNAQTQILISHEEEMRQNMEELQATQEEASRQTERLIVLEETINQSLIRAEFDAEGKLLYTNQLFTELFEYGRDTSIQGKNILDLLHVDEREHFKGVWKKLVKNNESFSGSIRHITRSGKDLFTMSSFHVMKNEDSSFAKVVMLAIDTTKEKFQVQKNEIIVDAISRNSIHLELDINGNILYGNSAFLQLFGLKKTDFKSLVVFDLVSPLELEAFNKHWEGIIKGSGYSGIVRGRLADDEEVWIRGSFNAVYNMAHEIERIVFMGQDMTKERNLESEVKTLHDTIKKQEKMLHEAEKNLIARLRETKNELMDQFKETERLKNLHEKILEDTPDAIITTSHDNRIVSFNKAAEQLWGIDRKEVLDHDVSILFPEKLAEKDELISSFIRPGENKITGRRKKCIIMDKKGREKSVMMMLTKAKVDHENAYMAFIQRPD